MARYPVSTCDLSELVCVKAINSVDFIKSIFCLYQQRQIFAVTNAFTVAEFYKTTGIPTTELITPTTTDNWLRKTVEPVLGNDPAQIVFTSGTEGKPKAIILSYNNLAHVVTRINRAMEVDKTIKEYVGVPIYHSFGLGRCRAVSAVGGECYIPQEGFNIKEIKKLLRERKINSISAVPSLWRIILKNSSEFDRLGKEVRWIEIGSQYMSASEKHNLREIFFNAKIVQHYGLTEASRTTLLRVDLASDEQLRSVGRAEEDVGLSVSPSGRLKIQGPHVAIGRVVEGKKESIVDAEGWLETSDLAEIKNGNLYYLARADDIINCGGIKIDPSRIENEVNVNRPLKNQIVISRIKDESRGDGILINVIETSTLPENKLIHEVDIALRKRGVNARAAIKLTRVASIPKTSTGKIQRKALTHSYEVEQTAAEQQPTEIKTVSDLFKSLFPSVEFQQEDTFASLGGDSLNYIYASMSLEKLLPTIPENWDKLSIQALSHLALTSNSTKNSKLSAVESSACIRAYAIVAVVIHHAGITFFAGGASLLLLVSGVNYARFQLNRNCSGQFGKFLSSMVLNILIPYWGVLLVIPFLKGDPVNFNYLALIGNFTSDSVNILPFPAWFICALTHSLCFFILPLLIPKCRQYICKNLFIYGIVMFTIAVVLRIVDDYFNWGRNVGIAGGQTSWVLWLFALGFVIYLATSIKKKCFLSGILILSCYFLYSGDISRIMTISTGGLLILWMPQLRIAKKTKPVITILGSSSLFIYFLHLQSPVKLFLPPVFGLDIVKVIIGISLGLIGWKLYDVLITFGLTKINEFTTRS